MFGMSRETRTVQPMHYPDVVQYLPTLHPVSVTTDVDDYFDVKLYNISAGPWVSLSPAVHV
jgi:hypothetical protein